MTRTLRPVRRSSDLAFAVLSAPLRPFTVPPCRLSLCLSSCSCCARHLMDVPQCTVLCVRDGERVRCERAAWCPVACVAHDRLRCSSYYQRYETRQTGQGREKRAWDLSLSLVDVDAFACVCPFSSACTSRSHPTRACVRARVRAHVRRIATHRSMRADLAPQGWGEHQHDGLRAAWTHVRTGAAARARQRIDRDVDQRVGGHDRSRVEDRTRCPAETVWGEGAARGAVDESSHGCDGRIGA